MVTSTKTHCIPVGLCQGGGSKEEYSESLQQNQSEAWAEAATR